MLNTNEIQELVSKHVHELSDWKKRIIPKRALVVDSTKAGRQLGYIPKGIRTEAQTLVPHYNFMGVRTVFDPSPILVDGENFYREVKGYGQDGKHLFPLRHSEGDLNFGMYFVNAASEYFLLKQVMDSQEIRTQKPLSLLEFPKEEFEKQLILGLVSLATNGQAKPEDASLIFGIYEKEGLEEVTSLLEELTGGDLKYEKKEFPYIIKEKAGYLVRASRCPFRIVYYDTKIPKDRLEQAVFEGGKSYAALIHLGLIHKYPNLRNITLAGELADFEDATPITDHDSLRRDWYFVGANCLKPGAVRTFHSFLSLLLSKQSFQAHIGPDFTQAFLEGTGLGRTPEQVAESIIEIHKESLQPLLEDRFG
ncbi:MAG: hypothetical protein ABIE22_02060 [archaeon]